MWEADKESNMEPTKGSQQNKGYQSALHDKMEHVSPIMEREICDTMRSCQRYLRYGEMTERRYKQT